MRSLHQLVANLLSLVWILVVALALENALLISGKNGTLHAPAPILPKAQVASVIAKNSADTVYISLTQLNELPLQGVPGKNLALTVGCAQLNSSQLHSPFSWLVTTELNQQRVCTLGNIEQKYGLPSKTNVVAMPPGSRQPALALITYNFPTPFLSNPTTKLAPRLSERIPAPAQHTEEEPQSDSIQLAGCSGNTILTFVAHEDDDILFTNPDLQHSLDNGRCAVTVYLTAGDDGQGAAYWRARERGSQNAYSSMLRSAAPWSHGQLSIANHKITVTARQAAQRAYLLFLRLPDGNLQGEGFAQTGNQSLLKLRQGSIDSLQAIDGSSRYSSKQLTASLLLLMQLLQPIEIHTQSYADGPARGDHSDHQLVAQYVRDAFAQLQRQNPTYHAPLKFYSGYIINKLASNLSDSDTLQKQQVFLAYSRGDRMICTTASSCDDEGYIGYLSREYSYGANEPAPGSP